VLQCVAADDATPRAQTKQMSSKGVTSQKFLEMWADMPLEKRAKLEKEAFLFQAKRHQRSKNGKSHKNTGWAEYFFFF